MAAVVKSLPKNEFQNNEIVAKNVRCGITVDL